MDRIVAYLDLWGETFSPARAEKLSGIVLSDKYERGEIPNYGIPTPLSYGTAHLDLESGTSEGYPISVQSLDLVGRHMKTFVDCGATGILIGFLIYSKGTSRLVMNSDFSSRVAALGLTMCISVYEEVGVTKMPEHTNRDTPSSPGSAVFLRFRRGSDASNVTGPNCDELLDCNMESCGTVLVPLETDDGEELYFSKTLKLVADTMVQYNALGATDFMCVINTEYPGDCNTEIRPSEFQLPASLKFDLTINFTQNEALGRAVYAFLRDDEVADLLGVTSEYFDNIIKPRMRIDFSEVLEELGNPADFGICLQGREPITREEDLTPEESWELLHRPVTRSLDMTIFVVSSDYKMLTHTGVKLSKYSEK